MPSRVIGASGARDCVCRNGIAAACSESGPRRVTASVFPVEVVSSGGARGCIQQPKVSMMIMCPPQHGQGGRRSEWCVGSEVSDGGGTASSSRALAMLALRVLLASRP